MEETNGAMPPSKNAAGVGTSGSIEASQSVGCRRRGCWGSLWAVVLLLSCPLSGCRIPKGLEVKTLDVVFLLPSRREVTNEVVPRRTRRGWGSRGSDLRVNRRGAEFWMPLMRVLGLLLAVVLLLSCSSCFFRRRCRVGVWALSVLYPRRGCWEIYGGVLGLLWAGVGTLMGGCLDIVMLLRPFARRCRVRVYGLCVLRP